MKALHMHANEIKCFFQGFPNSAREQYQNKLTLVLVHNETKKYYNW